jgi:hypothetical protein
MGKGRVGWAFRRSRPVTEARGLDSATRNAVAHDIEATEGEKEVRIEPRSSFQTLALRGRSVHACQSTRDSA